VTIDSMMNQPTEPSTPVEPDVPAERAVPAVQVIIDNMMNLELMWQASKLPGGKKLWHDMAVRHARRTLKDLIRYNCQPFGQRLGNSLQGLERGGVLFSSCGAEYWVQSDSNSTSAAPNRCCPHPLLPF